MIDRGAQARAAANQAAWFRRVGAATGRPFVAGALPWTIVDGNRVEAHGLFPELGDDASAVIDAWLDDVEAVDDVASVGLWSMDPPQPADLAGRLLARGFRWGWKPHWMGLDLAATHLDLACPPEVRIEPVTGNVDWRVSDLPEYGPVYATRIDALVAPPRQVWMFAAWMGDDVVGMAVTFVDEAGVAALYDVGVVPGARRRGIGAALTSHACHAAKEQGCTEVLLNATGMGDPVYRQVGFAEVGDGQTWWWSKDAPARVTDPDPIAFVEAIGAGDLDRLEQAWRALDEPDLDAVMGCGATPVEIGALCQQPGAVDWLAAHGAVIDLVSCWDLGWRDRVPELIAARPGLVDLKRGEFGATPLHVAAQRGDMDLARAVLAGRPNLAITDDRFRSTPAGWAAVFDRAELAALLAEGTTA